MRTRHLANRSRAWSLKEPRATRFFTQFLALLHQDGLFWHDPKDRVWKWDLGKIEARDFAEFVL